MLSQLKSLSLEADGRYATDAELQFMTDYVQSFNLRLQTYQKLQELEATLIQQAYVKLQSLDPTIFRSGQEDVSAKWKRDTLRTLRYTAVAMLINDPDTLQDLFLLWFQTIIRAFKAERACNITYQVLQDLMKHHLTPPQANLVCPILELTRRSLGAVA
ncbi:phycobilisome protein [Phormidium tenue FACHB-886]|nr:phycobilisome protein [Phormidium tenue FACHB-886]